MKVESKKLEKLEEEMQDPDFQDWYFGLTIGFLLEEMEFEEMVDEIYADTMVSGSKERGVKEPRDRSPLSSPLSPCR